jgi:hypothetical protein
MSEEREKADEPRDDETEQEESREKDEPEAPDEGSGVIRDDQGYGGQDSA